MIASRRRQALLLVGHGSAFGPAAGAPVRAHAERIRRWRIFDEVETAFVKESPHLEGAVDRLESEDVYVVPLFLAEGYYTRGVVPRRLGLSGGENGSDDAGNPITGDGSARQPGRRVRYSEAIGSHPAMIRAIERRARRVLGGDTPSGDTALVLIGHGTERHPNSADTVLRLTARLKRHARFGEVTCGFLDQEPRIDGVVSKLHARRVVLIPYFLADGMHTRETIPEMLGLGGAHTVRGDRELWYTPPVGTLPAVARIAVDLARREGARIDREKGGRTRRRAARVPATGLSGDSD